MSVNKYCSEKQTVNLSHRTTRISDVCSVSTSTQCATSSAKWKQCCRFPNNFSQKEPHSDTVDDCGEHPPFTMITLSLISERESHESSVRFDSGKKFIE